MPVEINKTGGFHFTIPGERSNPTTVAEFAKRLPKEWSNTEIHLTMRLWNPSRSTLAKLTSAFLTMFYTFGYEYILSNAANLMRAIFAVPPLKDLEFFVPSVTINPPNFRAPSVLLVDRVDGFRCFGVAFPNARSTSTCDLALLPGLAPDSPERFLDAIRNVTHPEVNVRAFRITSIDQLRQPTLIGVAHKIWNEPREMA